MIPGWLDESKLTRGAPADSPLPEAYVGTYSEGSDGVLLGATEVGFQQVSAVYEKSYFVERFGFGRSDAPARYDRMFVIEFRQEHAFGVLFLDSFTPPAIANEFFEFPDWLTSGCEGPPALLPLTVEVQGAGTATVEIASVITEFMEYGPSHSPLFTEEQGRESDGSGCQ